MSGICQHNSINMLQNQNNFQEEEKNKDVQEMQPEGRETSHPSILQEHQYEDGMEPSSVKTGDDVSEIASRIGVSLDEVRGNSLKTSRMFRYKSDSGSGSDSHGDG